MDESSFFLVTEAGSGIKHRYLTIYLKNKIIFFQIVVQTQTHIVMLNCTSHIKNKQTKNNSLTSSHFFDNKVVQVVQKSYILIKSIQVGITSSTRT